MEQVLTVLAELGYMSLLVILFTLAESIFYHVKDKSLDFNEHLVWTGIRVVAFAPVLVHWFFLFHWWSLIGFVGFGLYFIFLHDSFYYHFRNKLNLTIYPKGFKDVSHNSTAWWDIHVGTPAWNTRVAALGVGLFLLFGMVAGYLTS
jgi:hypothetical protein